MNLRSAVSIARRLQDPLAELVKIDPKAVGVGQYQHDMPPAQLSAALDGVVESCVNTVGVDLNTASAPLLARVAGVTAATAKNIVKYREDAGAFKTRRELLKVPKLGPKAFEQCAGFLRVPGAKKPAGRNGRAPGKLWRGGKAAGAVRAFARRHRNAGGSGAGTAGKAPGPREAGRRAGRGRAYAGGYDRRAAAPGPGHAGQPAEAPLRTDVLDMKDLTPGMQLTGTVRNVIDFGAFVDIGVHQDGLVHISQISSRFIRHPSEVLKVGDVVTVWVLSVDLQKKRIALTMKQPKTEQAH